MNDVTRILSAESALVATIRRAADTVAGVGTTSLPEAIAELKAAAEGAAARLTAARAEMAALLGGLADAIGELSADLDADLAGAPMAVPAQAEAPAVVTYTEPAVETTNAPEITPDVPEVPLPVNRVAEVLGVSVGCVEEVMAGTPIGPEPSVNGRAPKGKGRKPRAEAS